MHGCGPSYGAWESYLSPFPQKEWFYHLQQLSSTNRFLNSWWGLESTSPFCAGVLAGLILLSFGHIVVAMNIWVWFPCHAQKTAFHSTALPPPPIILFTLFSMILTGFYGSGVDKGIPFREKHLVSYSQHFDLSCISLLNAAQHKKICWPAWQ